MNLVHIVTDRQLAFWLKKLRSEAVQERSTALLPPSLDLKASEFKESHDAFARSVHLFIRIKKGDSLLPSNAHLLEILNHRPARYSLRNLASFL